MTLRDTASRPPVGDPVPVRAPGDRRWGWPAAIAAATAATLWGVSKSNLPPSIVFGVALCGIAGLGIGFGLAIELDRRTPVPTTVRVLARLPSRWRLGRLFLIGVVLQSIASELNTGVISTALLAVMVLYFMIPAAVLVFLSRYEQRLGRALLEAVSLATGYQAAGWILPVWAAKAMPLSVLEFVLGFLESWLTLAGLFALVRIIGLWGIRVWGRTVVLQTGTLCWTCGYDLTGNESGVCPECGRAAGCSAP